MTFNDRDKVVSPTRGAISIFKLPLLVLLGFFLSSFLANAQSIQPQLDELFGHDRLSNPQGLLKPLMDGQQTIKIIVTLRPNQAGLELAKPNITPNQIDSTSPTSSNPVGEYGDTHYELVTNKGKQALAAAVDEKLSIFLSEIKTTEAKAATGSSSSISSIVITNQFKYVFGFAAEVTQEGLNQLLEKDDVLLIEENITLKPQLKQGIPLMNGISARSTYNGSGIAVAVVDTGIDTTHPRLDGGKVLGGYDFGMDDSNFQPSGNAHGTAVAGIVAGDTGTVGDYIGGVAPGAKLYGLKISNDTNHQATSADMIDAWEWTLTHKNDSPDNPILVVNTSFGGGRFFSSCDTADSVMTQAALNGVSAGITFFVSSGNDGYCDSMAWPACISHVNSIGAVYDDVIGTFGSCISTSSCLTTTFNSACPPGTGAFFDSTFADKVAAYSNSDTNLAFFASSNSATTTDISGSGGYGAGDYANSFGGTSAASPYAAGAAAVLQHAAKSTTGNFLSPAQVKTIFASTGNNVTDTKASLTRPRINIGNAVASIVPPPVIPPVDPDDGFLLMALPPILAAVQGGTPPPSPPPPPPPQPPSPPPIVINPQWSVYNEVCCPSASATYIATQNSQSKLSTAESCSGTATFSGYVSTAPGSKSFTHLLSSSGCPILSSSSSANLQSGRQYLWVMELVNGNPTAVLYSSSIGPEEGGSLTSNLSDNSVREEMEIEQTTQLLLEQASDGQSKYQRLPHRLSLP